jgi:hypothetical protein
MRDVTDVVLEAPEPLGLVVSLPEATLGPAQDLVSGQPDTKQRKPKQETINEGFKAMMLRMVRAYLRRVEAGDLQALADFVEVHRYMSLALNIAVAAQRNHRDNPASWAGIAKATGLSRSAAQERWGALGGLRRAGGQRWDWR